MIDWTELDLKVKKMGREISTLSAKDQRLLKHLDEQNSKLKDCRIKRNKIRKAIGANQLAWTRLGNSMSTYRGCKLGLSLRREFDKCIDEAKSIMITRSSVIDKRRELKHKIYLVSRQISNAQVDKEIKYVLERPDGSIVMKIKFTAYIKSTMVEDSHIITYWKKTDGLWYRITDVGAKPIDPNYSLKPDTFVDKKKNKHEELETLLKIWHETNSEQDGD